MGEHDGRRRRAEWFVAGRRPGHRAALPSGRHGPVEISDPLAFDESGDDVGESLPAGEQADVAGSLERGRSARRNQLPVAPRDLRRHDLVEGLACDDQRRRRDPRAVGREVDCLLQCDPAAMQPAE